jgi:hypothetical protein
VSRNECADMFTLKAVLSGGRTMDHGDVLHCFREAGWVEDSHEHGNSTTIVRLRDGHIKLGTARHEHFVGSNSKTGLSV